ncbi:flagellar basal body rod protein FlgG [Chengkuizengella axinellae]|uniref:Flagellar hook protein FlgE n=1 Tax=Chengkuizengella axinellae TaxID=3064388 RepID=A0ABT9IVQ9_9BACL|nr:flagellar basal body rod protein FlgG [Chengkuizengella sp. 2205SS18-9]MDP5273446.1 flagellar basal body rod protein FlgG [Chengkuizengella sp. 2205SS18-9]
MLRSLYSGISGMQGFQTKLDVIGNNIANVNTTGFKAGRVMFQDVLNQQISGGTAPNDINGGSNAKEIGLGVTVGAIDTIHTPGSAMTTNVPTDLRIDGDGFFAVAPNTDVETAYLTRAGNFSVDANGNIVNSNGLFLLDSEGEVITIDTEEVTSFYIAQDGEIVSVNAEGVSEGTDIRVGIAKVTNPSGLEKLGGNLYRVTPNSDTEAEEPLDLIGTANDPDTGTGSIISGQLEMSNVDLTSEFSEMIVAQRGFQSNSRIITTSDEILQEIVNLKR